MRESGYATIQDVLTDKLSAFHLLLLLFVLKLLVTSLTLGSGASGGIFSPSLFMGATLGAAYGVVLNWCFPGMDKGLSGFAVAGMAGVVGGATGATMAAIVMIFEMTLDYNVIIPITITVALSYGVRKVLCPESIYTLKLTRRGHHIPSALYANFSHVKHVKDIMRTGIMALPASSTLDEFAKTVLEHPEQTHFLVHEGDRIVGLVGREAGRGGVGSAHAGRHSAKWQTPNSFSFRRMLCSPISSAKCTPRARPWPWWPPTATRHPSRISKESSRSTK